MSTIAASTILADRFQQLAANRVVHTQNASSIELTASKATNNTSIELPQEIDDLIDYKGYRNKFKKLIREGHLNDLLELAKMARENATEEAPSHYFARATRTTPLPGHEGEPTMWDRSLKHLAKLRKVREQAARIAQKIGAKVDDLKFIYKQIWNGVNVERWAVTAEEVRHDKPGQGRVKHFAWLCLNEKRLTV